jgi:hypothetical protein
MGIAHHQTFLFQTLDSFADGRSTDLQPVGQRPLDKAFAGGKMTRDDRSTKPAVDLVEHPSDASDGERILQLFPPSWSTGGPVLVE